MACTRSTPTTSAPPYNTSPWLFRPCGQGTGSSTPCHHCGPPGMLGELEEEDRTGSQAKHISSPLILESTSSQLHFSSYSGLSQPPQAGSHLQTMACLGAPQAGPAWMPDAHYSGLNAQETLISLSSPSPSPCQDTGPPYSSSFQKPRDLASRGLVLFDASCWLGSGIEQPRSLSQTSVVSPSLR